MNLLPTIEVERGALVDVPIVELARFLASHGLILAANTKGGMTIRRAHQPVDYATPERNEREETER